MLVLKLSVQLNNQYGNSEIQNNVIKYFVIHILSTNFLLTSYDSGYPILWFCNGVYFYSVNTFSGGRTITGPKESIGNFFSFPKSLSGRTVDR